MLLNYRVIIFVGSPGIEPWTNCTHCINIIVAVGFLTQKAQNISRATITLTPEIWGRNCVYYLRPLNVHKK